MITLTCIIKHTDCFAVMSSILLLFPNSHQKYGQLKQYFSIEKKNCVNGTIRASIFKNSEFNILTCRVGYIGSNKSALKHPVTQSKKKLVIKMLCQIIFIKKLG